MVKTLLVRVIRNYGGTDAHRTFSIEPLVKIEFKGVSMALKGNGKVLLENVSGVYNPGQMHAIMGPSGSGQCPGLRMVETQTALLMWNGKCCVELLCSPCRRMSLPTRLTHRLCFSECCGLFLARGWCDSWLYYYHAYPGS